MKKHLFFAALASVALAGCVNNESNTAMDAPEPLVFEAPTLKTQTRLYNGEIAGESTSKERNYLYAIKAVASKPLGKGKLSFGTEETFTNRHDLFLQSGFSADANNHVKQSLWSAFANYSWAFGKWNLSAGFRYEHQQTDYYEKNIHQKEQSPTYDDFIPALSANYRNGDWNLILSYKKNKDNPGYHLLSDAINYRSKYEYMTGNPLLPKQISNLLSLDASWKWIYLNAWYQHVKNSLTTVTQAYNDETHPGVTIIDYQAIPDSYSYGTAITLAPKFGIWQPQATINFSFWDSDLKAIGIDKTKGSIEIGKDADFCFADEQFNISRTILRGRTIYEA